MGQPSPSQPTPVQSEILPDLKQAAWGAAVAGDRARAPPEPLGADAVMPSPAVVAGRRPGTCTSAGVTDTVRLVWAQLGSKSSCEIRGHQRAQHPALVYRPGQGREGLWSLPVTPQRCARQGHSRLLSCPHIPVTPLPPGLPFSFCMQGFKTQPLGGARGREVPLLCWAHRSRRSGVR